MDAVPVHPQRLPHDWFPADVPACCSIGEGSWLYSSFAFLHCRSAVPDAVRIGAHSGVYNGTFFDLGPRGSVQIGDYCTVVGAIFAVDGPVRIGSYGFVAHEVVFAQTDFAVPGASGHEDAARPAIELGANVWVGARAVILAGARVGEGAIIGAATVVSSEVPPFAIVAGNPARVVGDSRAR